MQAVLALQQSDSEKKKAGRDEGENERETCTPAHESTQAFRRLTTASVRFFGLTRFVGGVGKGSVSREAGCLLRCASARCTPPPGSSDPYESVAKTGYGRRSSIAREDKVPSLRRFLRVAAGLVPLALCGGLCEAQSFPSPGEKNYLRFEIAILGGYRFESTLTFRSADAPYARVEIDNAPTYGVTLGWNYGPNTELEVEYSHASPKARAIATNPANPNRSFDIGIDDIQLGWLANFNPTRSRVRPYLGLGLGATILDADQNVGGGTKVSINVTAGVKFHFSEHVGLRAEVHYIPAYLYTTGTGFEWCFDAGNTNCWNTGDRYLQQLDLRAGATFRF